MRKFKLLTLLAAALMTVNTWGQTIAGGSCGDNLTWSHHYPNWPNTDTEIILIEGTGDMADYTSTTCPWRAFRTKIVGASLPEGLTKIGMYAFYDCTHEDFTALTIPSTVTTINTSALDISHLETLTCLPATAPTISGTPIPNHAESFEIVYPCGSGESYVNGWTTFYNYLTPALPCAEPKPTLHYEGTCGTDVNFSLDGSTLTISGTGTTMSNYTTVSGQPWKDYREIITTVVIENGITTIGRNNFASCTYLSSVTLPATLTTIGRQAFNNCTHLTSITLPASVSSIERDAFASSGLEAITIPSNVTTITQSTFSGCVSLTSVTISSGVSTIERNAFQNCSTLVSISIPATVTTIGNQVFSGSVNLESVTFQGSTPPSLGTLPFYNTSASLKIYVPDADAQAYADAWPTYIDKLYKATSGDPVAGGGEPEPTEGDFGPTNNLHWAYADNVLTITGSGSTGGLGIGGEDQPWKSYNSDIQTIYLPAGITNIGEDDFYAMTSVDYVYLPADPAGLIWDEGEWVDDFKGEATPKTTCYVPAAYLSTYNTNFTSVNVTFAAEPVANACGDNLTWDLTGNVLTISGTGAMYDYDGTDMPWYSSRYSITSIVLPAGMTHIGNYAFYSCSQVASIDIPSSVISIGNNAFQFCSNITSISLPSGLTSLGSQAFSGCSKIASSITIPSGITAIADNAFSGCSKIPSVTLHSGVISIGVGTFSGCAELTTISIPAAVTSIGISAFASCTKLATVTCLPTTAPTLGNNAFYDHPENLVITYPNGSDQDYANKFLQYYDYLRNATTSAQAPLPHLSGTFSGGTLTWDLSFTGTSGTLMEHDGTLAISGTGAMDDYDWTNNVWAPWFYYADFINHVNIASGVTKIGESAFAQMTHVNTFIIPATVTYIGGDAFFQCDNEEMIVYCYANPATLEWHDNVSAFEGEGWMPDDFLTLTRNAWGNYEWHVQATKCVVPSQYLEGYKAKWARGGDYKWWDLNVWFASELQDGESAEYINNALSDLNGQTAPVVTLVRPLQRNGYFATICLPFNMSAAQIAESSLHGAEIKEFTGATVDGGTLNIEFTPVSAIEAGKPYFIKYTDPETLGDALDRIDFMDVVINNTTPVAVTHGGLTMTGTYVPKAVSVQTSATDGDGVLFLGANNSLYWPNVAGNIKPFRAYFSIAGSGPGMPKKGMPARIVEKEQTPTAINNTAADRKYNKTLENGMLLIEKNGVRYNAQGQIVK